MCARAKEKSQKWPCQLRARGVASSVISGAMMSINCYTAGFLGKSKRYNNYILEREREREREPVLVGRVGVNYVGLRHCG